MTRLRDRYEHEFQAALENHKISAGDLETYDEWLDRIGCNERDDDAGEYGDESPTWGDEIVQNKEK